MEERATGISAATLQDGVSRPAPTDGDGVMLGRVLLYATVIVAAIVIVLARRVIT
jgi:hypothetical protein